MIVIERKSKADKNYNLLHRIKKCRKWTVELEGLERSQSVFPFKHQIKNLKNK